MMRIIVSTHGLKRLTANIFFKRYIFIFVLSLFGLGAIANPHLASKKQIGMFMNSKTCVVLDNGSMLYNVLLKNAVEKYWKSTKFEFIDQVEFEKQRFDSKYSFIILMKVVFDKDPSDVSYNYINLVLGDTARNMTEMPELCSIPLLYSSDNNIKYGYAIPAIIKFMQKHVITLNDKHFLISLRGLKYYNGLKSCKSKVLLLNKDMMAMDANSTEEIKSVYKYQVKLLTTPEIESELATNNTNLLFNFHVGPSADSKSGKCFDMIFDSEGNLYYYNSRMITNENKDGFNQKDFSYIW
jgi:hypothetical protein